MGSVTASVRKPEGGGCTGGSGRRGSRAATASGSPPSPWPGTRAPGPTDCKTDTDRRHTPTAVRTSYSDMYEYMVRRYTLRYEAKF